MRSVNENKAESFTVYADARSLRLANFCVAVITVGFICVVIIAVAADTWYYRLLFTALAASCLFFIPWLKHALIDHYRARVIFDREGITCSPHGKAKKRLLWSEVRQVVRVTHHVEGSFSNADVDYLIFSGHELCATEKNASIELDDGIEDIIVVRFSRRLVKRIKKLRDLSFADEHIGLFDERTPYRD